MSLKRNPHFFSNTLYLFSVSVFYVAFNFLEYQFSFSPRKWKNFLDVIEIVQMILICFLETSGDIQLMLSTAAISSQRSLRG